MAQPRVYDFTSRVHGGRGLGTRRKKKRAVERLGRFAPARPKNYCVELEMAERENDLLIRESRIQSFKLAMYRPIVCSCSRALYFLRQRWPD